MKKLSHFLAIFFALITILAAPAYAGPESGPVYVVWVRPYIGSDIVYIQTDNAPGTFCPGTSMYSISMASNAGKAAYAAAVTALALGKTVKLEALACGGSPANPLQSIYINAN